MSPIQLLCDSLESHLGALGVTIHAAAVGARFGSIRLSAGENYFHSVAKSVEGAETTAHAIPMVAFRETMDRLGSVVDFLKLDREGSEWKTLERCRE